jgi:hypothetical protein
MCSAGAYVQVAMKGPQDAKCQATELIVVTTDWKLEDAGGKTYGMCFVRVSPPYDHLNFKRGFSLPCPTHQRCALFALVLGMEMVDSIPAVTERPEFVIATKNSWICDTLVRHKVDEWDGNSHWPKHTASVKGLLLRARDVMAELPGRSTLVYIPREDDDENHVDLISKEEDTDVDAITKKGGGQQEIEKALRDMRMRGVMINELMASGARSSRAKAVSGRKDKKKKKMTPGKQQQAKDVVVVNKPGKGDGPLGDGDAVRPAEEHRDDPPVAQFAAVGREQCAEAPAGSNPC